VSEATPSPTSPPGRRFRLTADTWAVLFAAVLTLLVAVRAIPRVPW
jgi:hypothetical protein